MNGEFERRIEPFNRVISKRVLLNIIDEMRRSYRMGNSISTIAQDDWFNRWFGEK